jgi:hypothetical protein
MLNGHERLCKGRGRKKGPSIRSLAMFDYCGVLLQRTEYVGLDKMLPCGNLLRALGTAENHYHVGCESVAEGNIDD